MRASSLSLAITRLAPIASSAAWSPIALWPDGIATPGMWISPRDLTSQWQDYAGTTPVVTPGTVADSSNPVGLALDIRAGNPVPLGPELVVNGDMSSAAGWSVAAGVTIGAGVATFAAVNSSSALYRAVSVSAGKTYQYEFDLVASGGSVQPVIFGDAAWPEFSSSGHKILRMTATAPNGNVGFRTNFFTGSIDNISVKEILGNHMLQSTSVARPLLSAYDGQTLGPGDTYDGTGYPVFQKYNGTNSSMATAAFAAGTLISSMDCLMAVRRDSAGNAVVGLYESVAEANKVFGIAESGSASGAVGSGAGTPTVWVDGVQLTGGTAVTRGTLHTALSAGSWHILELRGLDLSTWTAAGFGKYTSYILNGALGETLLFPSGQDANRDLARAAMADYFGVTLP